jgi:hypothetical protein
MPGDVYSGQEIELQKLIANWLNLHSIYFEWDRTDKHKR